MNQPAKLAVVVLAAGQGKRMGGQVPKVLRDLKGQTIISRLIKAINQSGIVARPVVVVSDDHTLIQESLGEQAVYVVQAEQLGTGHATSCAAPLLTNQADQIIVLYGDMPLIKSQTLQALAKTCETNHHILTMFTTEVKDFEDWRSSFYNFGRIIRGQQGQVLAVKEKKDCRLEELQIKEVNPGLYCFKAEWLWQNLGGLDNQNAQREYYLTDLVKKAIEQGLSVATVKINPEECIGINTPEELELALREILDVKEEN